jgi:hypothetical protein
VVYTPPMKVLVCGSRKWLEQKPIERELRKLPPGSIVVHGACKGADKIAEYVARDILGLKTRAYPANWASYGKAAGTLRNQAMLNEEHPDNNDVCIDKVLVFHEDPDLGRGTKDMVGRARLANPTIVVEIFSS